MAAKRYAVVQNGTIINVVLWDGTSPLDVPAGATTLLEKDALAQGLLPSAAPDFTARARAAIALNAANITQDQAIAQQADTVATGTGTLTAAQLTPVVRQLAGAIRDLAKNDVQSSRQRTSIIQQLMTAFDDTGV